jgi:hypothetical protein
MDGKRHLSMKCRKWCEGTCDAAGTNAFTAVFQPPS